MKKQILSGFIKDNTDNKNNIYVAYDSNRCLRSL